jgi:hypothetical protein
MLEVGARAGSALAGELAPTEVEERLQQVGPPVAGLRSIDR